MISPRPAHLQRSNRDRARHAQANAEETPEISNPETPSQPTIEAAPPPVAPSAAADIPASGVPAILNRKIAIMGIERRDTAAAVQFAESSPEPAPEALYEHIYVEG